MQNCSTFVNYWKCFFFFFFFEFIKTSGSTAAPVKQWLLISPVESIGDDVVVHKLPSPPEFNGDVELENREADRSQMWGRIQSQPEERQEKHPALCPAAMSESAVVVVWLVQERGRMLRADITFQFSFICIAPGTISYNRKEEILGVGTESMITLELTPRQD